MRRTVLLVLALAGASAPCVNCQRTPPKLEVDWLAGGPVAFAEDRTVLVLFWNGSTPLAKDIVRAGQLWRRWYRKKVDVVLVLSTDKTEGLADRVKTRKRGRAAIALDKTGAVSRAWNGDNAAVGAFVVEDGRLAWSGRKHMLGRWFILWRDRERDRAFLRAQAKLAHEIVAAQRARDYDEQLRLAQSLIDVSNVHHEGWLVRLRAHRDTAREPVLAKETVASALAALGARPGQLVSFIKLGVLRGKPDAEDLLLALQSLRSTARRGGDSIDVQLTLLAVAERAGRPQVAERAALRAAEMIEDDPATLKTFANALLASKNPGSYRGAARRVVAAMRALESQRGNQAFQIQLFDLMHGLAGDLEGARELGVHIVDILNTNSSLNTFAWQCLTYPHRKGKFKKLSLVAAEKMQKSGKGLTYYMLDTIALAKFENGLIDEAIALQKKSIASGQATREYEARLRRYEAAKEKRRK